MIRIRTRTTLALALCGVIAAVSPAAALDAESFQENITVETLENGLTVIAYERHTSPTVSFLTFVDAGGSQEVPGITGLAHMFEHMAFKGTTRIGTTDAKAEKKAMAAVDDAYTAWATERDRKGGPDEARLSELKAALEKAQEAAGEFITTNEFPEIIERAGGSGLNAGTGKDATQYNYSLPANKIELWAYLESERFLDPVLREFYKERDVVQEERRMNYESNPIRRALEQHLCVSYIAHTYGTPNIGYMSDLERFTREDAAAFYKKYYVPSNMTVAVVGDFKRAEVMPILKKYFSRIPAGPTPPPLRTFQPPQIAEKTLILPEESQPIYLEGYHRPEAMHPDDAIYDALADLLSSGRTSRLYRSLVRDKQVAASAGAFNGLPGDKYPTTFTFFGVPTPDHSNDEVQAAIREEIEKLKSEPVTDEELQMVKTRSKANLIRGLQSNMGIARQLAYYQVRFGDWRELFENVERIDKVSKEDIMRVAEATFVPTNRTVTQVVNKDSVSE